jgi:leucyl-tRNA synthetase
MLDVKAIHPVTKKQLPLLLADYVIADYGTGAVMGIHFKLIIVNEGYRDR